MQGHLHALDASGGLAQPEQALSFQFRLQCLLVNIILISPCDRKEQLFKKSSAPYKYTVFYAVLRGANM